MRMPGRTVLSGAVIALLLVAPVLADTATFTGTGHLPTGKIRAYGVSQDGTVAVGEALDGAGKTQAFVWTSAGGLHGIGFLSQINKESHARDVGVKPNGQIVICGYSKDDTNKDRAFLWTGDATGSGAFETIPLLAGGAQNKAYALHVVTDASVLVTGDSESSAAAAGKLQGFYWQTGEPDCDGIGFLGGTDPDSHGRGIGIRDGITRIVGYSNSRWGGTEGNSRMAASWEPSTLGGDWGLGRVCGGEGWQILAGPNGIAETTATVDNLQVTPVGTAGLDPDTVVVSAGPDNILKDQTNAAGDDVEAPAGRDEVAGHGSLYQGTSPNGRYRVGRSSYIAGAENPFEAILRDIRNRDFTSPDNCGGFVFHWPLGFAKVDNTGAPIADDYSEAYGVSNGASPTVGRNGLVAVGYSLRLSDPTPRATRAVICMIQDGLDLWFLRQQGADISDYGARVASRFKDMRNLQWLLSHDFGLDLTGWDLREATAVSDGGTVVVGWGLHNGVEEGFVATIPGLASQGGCCNHHTLSCTITFPGDCAAQGGEFLGAEVPCTKCCPLPFSDGDLDGDVDMDDFARFQACLTAGPLGGGPAVQAGCECWDANGDDAIDDNDFVHGFINCGNGPDVPADPNCN